MCTYPEKTVRGDKTGICSQTVCVIRPAQQDGERLERYRGLAVEEEGNGLVTITGHGRRMRGRQLALFAKGPHGSPFAHSLKRKSSKRVLAEACSYSAASRAHSG